MSYIYDMVQNTRQKYNLIQSDPYALLDAMSVTVRESYNYGVDGLKGYCLSVDNTDFVVLNGKLLPPEKRIIACHEAAHLILHKDIIKNGFIGDYSLFDTTSETEYEANAFTADFLISDNDVISLAAENDMDYFSICKALSVNPALLNFKLSGMKNRGFHVNLPSPPDSSFLRKAGFA